MIYALHFFHFLLYLSAQPSNIVVPEVSYLLFIYIPSHSLSFIYLVSPSDMYVCLTLFFWAPYLLLHMTSSIQLKWMLHRHCILSSELEVIFLFSKTTSNTAPYIVHTIHITIWSSKSLSEKHKRHPSLDLSLPPTHNQSLGTTVISAVKLF